MSDGAHSQGEKHWAHGLTPRIWWRRGLGIVVLSAVFFGLLQAHPPSGLSLAAWRALALFLLIVSLWISELVPLAVTSLLAIGLIPLLDIMPAEQTYAYFGSKVVFFILGAFILGAALVGSGLSSRLALVAVDRFGRTPRRLLATIFLIGAVGSCVISEHAVAAMLFPLALAVSRQLEESEEGLLFGRMLFFALAWGCIIGGTTTLLGGGRGPLALGILEEFTHHAETITFLEYARFGLPLVGTLLVGGVIYLALASRRATIDLGQIRARMRSELASKGRISIREIGVAVVMTLTIAAWVTRGEEWGLANVAIVATAVLFLLGLMVWKDVEEGVNWAILLMYGGAICLGSALQHSGAATWLTGPLREADGLSPQLILLILGTISVVLTELMSNSAVIAVLVPVALEIGAARGIDLRVVTMAVVLPSNFAFALPMSTPANALAFSSGLIPIRTMVKYGIRLSVLAWGVFAFLIFIYWPLLGYTMGE